MLDIGQIQKFISGIERAISEFNNGGKTPPAYLIKILNNYKALKSEAEFEQYWFGITESIKQLLLERAILEREILNDLFWKDFWSVLDNLKKMMAAIANELDEVPDSPPPSPSGM